MKSPRISFQRGLAACSLLFGMGWAVCAPAQLVYTETVRADGLAVYTFTGGSGTFEIPPRVEEIEVLVVAGGGGGGNNNRAGAKGGSGIVIIAFNPKAPPGLMLLPGQAGDRSPVTEGFL